MLRKLSRTRVNNCLNFFFRLLGDRDMAIKIFIDKKPHKHLVQLRKVWKIIFLYTIMTFIPNVCCNMHKIHILTLNAFSFSGSPQIWPSILSSLTSSSSSSSSSSFAPDEDASSWPDVSIVLSDKLGL